MSNGSGRVSMLRGLVVIAACLLALVAFRPGPFALHLEMDRGGMTFLLKASAVKLAFDIGQVCSETNRGLGQ